MRKRLKKKLRRKDIARAYFSYRREQLRYFPRVLEMMIEMGSFDDLGDLGFIITTKEFDSRLKEAGITCVNSWQQ